MFEHLAPSALMMPEETLNLFPLTTSFISVSTAQVSLDSSPPDSNEAAVGVSGTSGSFIKIFYVSLNTTDTETLDA